jgi:hypothetical protein
LSLLNHQSNWFVQLQVSHSMIDPTIISRSI